MQALTKTTSESDDFRQLVGLLDQDLALRDGDDHAFYAQFNKIDALQHVIVCYWDGLAVGCGAFKPFDTDAIEVKRMYVLREKRGNGIARKILQELEQWAQSLDYKAAYLETGKRQPEAIALYTSSGYAQTPNYGQYANVEDSVCFRKVLR